MRSRRAAAASCLMLSAALLGAVPEPAAPPSSDALVRQLLEIASPDHAARARLPLDAPDRTWWERSPVRRQGLAIGEMDEPERRALDRLLESVLGPRGFRRVREVIAEQDLLTPEEGIGSGYFWFAVYGDPYGDARWGWRLGGHHVSIHVTYEGKRLVSVLPMFLGGEVGDPGVLGERVAAGRRIVRALGAEASRGRLGAELPHLLAEAARRSGFPSDFRGVDGSRVPPALRESFVEEFTGDLADEHVRATRERILATEPGLVRFAWAGSAVAGEPFYGRLLGPDFVLEVWDRGGHVHSILSAQQDFGGPAGR